MNEQMLALKIPTIFFKSWFWLPIAVGLIVIACIAGRKGPPAFPRVGKSLAKHKTVIPKINDIFIFIVLLLFTFPTIVSVRDVFVSLSTPEPIRKISVQAAWMTLFIFLTVWSGMSGFLVGLLSVFQTNLTRTKRVILLGICLLPIVLSVLVLMIEPSLGFWSTIKLGLGYSLGCWVINGPAILIGKHFLPVSWNIMRKLRWVSGDYPG